jgi:folate-binding protein YgfZ
VIVLDLPGAVRVSPEGPDEDIAAHYGDPYREQRALVESLAFVDRSDRDVLRVTGPDRLSWLHSLTTQHLEQLAPMHGSEALVLSPTGRVEHHLVLGDDSESTWIDVEPGTGKDLAAFLESMRFMLRVEVMAVDAAVLSVAGAQLSRLADLLPVPPGAYELARRDQLLVRRRPWPEPSLDVLVPRDQLAGLVEQLLGLGAVPAGIEAWEALRVAAGKPRSGLETDHKTIPHEVGWLADAVHLDKGCYRGQETVARVYNLGRPPRRMVLLHLDGSDSTLPQHGDDVTQDGRVVGAIGSAVRHYELGPIALAVVRRATPDDATLLAGGVPATIESLAGLTGKEEPAVRLR